MSRNLLLGLTAAVLALSVVSVEAAAQVVSPTAPAYPGVPVAPAYPGVPGVPWPGAAAPAAAPVPAAAPAAVPAPAVVYGVPQPVGHYWPMEPALRYPWFISGRTRTYWDGSMRYRVNAWWEDGYYRVHREPPRIRKLFHF